MRRTVLFPLVQAAGLVEVEPRCRYDSMVRPPRPVRHLDPRFVALQSERALYVPLGRLLESFGASNACRPVEAAALSRAAQPFLLAVAGNG